MLRGTLSSADGKLQLSSKGGDFGFGAVYYAAKPKNPARYQVTVRFNVASKTDAVGMMLPVGDKWAQLVLGGWAGQYSGINNINGKLVNSAKNPSYSTAGFVFGKQVTVQLRVYGGQVRLTINGRRLSQFNYLQNEIKLISRVRSAVKKLEQKLGQSGGIGFYVQRGSVEISGWNLTDL